MKQWHNMNCGACVCVLQLVHSALHNPGLLLNITSYVCSTVSLLMVCSLAAACGGHLQLPWEDPRQRSAAQAFQVGLPP